MLCDRNTYYKENFLWPPDPLYKQKIIKMPCLFFVDLSYLQAISVNDIIVPIRYNLQAATSPTKRNDMQLNKQEE